MTTDETEGVWVLGVRHHGPGSARAVGAELERLSPDAVLIEGPPEADALTHLVGDLEPPVALLAHRAVPAKGGTAKGSQGKNGAAENGEGNGGAPGKADGPGEGGGPDGTVGAQGWAFWPFASFSPEWVALRYAVEHGVEVRFCDLPATHTLAEEPEEPEGAGPGASGTPEAPHDPADPEDPTDPDAPADAAERAGDSGRNGAEGPTGPGGEAAQGPADPAGRAEDGDRPQNPLIPGDLGEEAVPAEQRIPADPLGVLANAAGYEEAERWWDDVVEQRGDGEPSPFPAILEAMTAVRAEVGPVGERNERREAHMRKVLRATRRAGYRRIAVVCGAWHAPALHEADRYTVKDDNALLKGLPKVKVEATWVPWTHGRLATSTGYRAGVFAPGWYHHLFTAPDRPVHRWLTDVARVLREEEGKAVSSAHVIEGVRLAEALATLRGRPLAGLDELHEAVTGVLCEGEGTLADPVHGRVAIGERMGSVPENTPMVPLQRDLIAQRRRLRLKAEPFARDIDLDLRKDTHRERSVLLHRLHALDVEWGVFLDAESGNRGTFRESWRLCWKPEMDVVLIELAYWGTTVEAAATARLAALAEQAGLSELTAFTEHCLLAELDGALPTVLAELSDRAATDGDVTELMAALPPLARAGRYGDVRRTEGAHLHSVAEGLLRRVCAGLAPVLRGLDDEAAEHVATLLDSTNGAVALLGQGPTRTWTAALTAMADDDRLPGILAGRVNRLLDDAGELDRETLRRRLARTMSPGADPARAVAWLEGFLQGSGLILVHDDTLLGLIDTWLLGLGPERFTAVLPLLRRTFGAFTAPERRQIGRAVTRGARHAADGTTAAPVDAERAAPAVEAVGAILARAAEQAEATEEATA